MTAWWVANIQSGVCCMRQATHCPLHCRFQGVVHARCMRTGRGGGLARAVCRPIGACMGANSKRKGEHMPHTPCGPSSHALCSSNSHEQSRQWGSVGVHGGAPEQGSSSCAAIAAPCSCLYDITRQAHGCTETRDSNPCRVTAQPSAQHMVKLGDDQWPSCVVSAGVGKHAQFKQGLNQGQGLSGYMHSS